MKWKLLSKCSSGLLAALLWVAPTLHAQNYFVHWFTISSGGGMSAGGAYSLSGTVAQPDDGSMSGGSFNVQGGFWAVLSEIVVEGPPEITIRMLSNGSVQICWPSSAAGFSLREAPTLDSSAWAPAPLAAVDDGTTNCVTMPLPTGIRFFRLVK